MDNLRSYITKDTLTHAYGIEGNVEDTIQKLFSHIEKVLEIPIKGNPDVQVLQFEMLGIGEARGLEEASRVKAFGKGGKLFLITTNTITQEAQSALLKLFEEPTERTHFFLLMPNCEILLPTLRSRLFLISMGGQSFDGSRAEAFTKTSMKDRLVLLKEIIDAKDKSAAITFLNELEVYLHDSIHKGGKNKGEVHALNTIEQARSYLNDRAPSVKMLLEHVALSVPPLR